LNRRETGAGDSGLGRAGKLQDGDKVTASYDQGQAVFQARREAGVLKEQGNVDHGYRLEARALFGHVEVVQFQLLKGREAIFHRG